MVASAFAIAVAVALLLALGTARAAPRAPSAAVGLRRRLAGLLPSTHHEFPGLRGGGPSRGRVVPKRLDALWHRPADRAHGARRGNHRSPGGVLECGGARPTRELGWPAHSHLRLGAGHEGLPGNALRGHPAGGACLGHPQVGAAERVEASRRVPRPPRQGLLLPSEPPAPVRLAGLHRGADSPPPADAGAGGLERAQPAALLRAPAVAAALFPLARCREPGSAPQWRPGDPRHGRADDGRIPARPGGSPPRGSSPGSISSPARHPSTASAPIPTHRDAPGSGA